MKLKKGDMWSAYGKHDLFLITGNSFVKGSGKLVMGCGMALQAKDRFPELPRQFGHKILKNFGHRGYYGIIYLEKGLTG